MSSSIQKRHRSQSRACFQFWGILTCIHLLLELDPGGWAEFHSDYRAEGQEGILGGRSILSMVQIAGISAMKEAGGYRKWGEDYGLGEVQ